MPNITCKIHTYDGAGGVSDKDDWISLTNTDDNPAELQPWSRMLAVTYSSAGPITLDCDLLPPYPGGSMVTQDVKLRSCFGIEQLS